MTTQLTTRPCVFSVEDEYQIIFVTRSTGMAWVEIEGTAYRDAANGLMRWNDTTHRITVPQAVLDNAGSYTVCFQEMTERKPYWPEHGETLRMTLPFTPVPATGEICISFLSDTHGKSEAPIACLKDRPCDVLVMAGDIADHNSTRKDLELLLSLADGVVHGEKPVICARGNHDTRGQMAWYLPQIMGTRGGHTYFTVKLPGAFCIVLDCGEDKLDFHAEYGETTAFEEFRREETRWLEDVVARGDWQDCPIRFALCHIPFDTDYPAPFHIELDVYRRWIDCMHRMGIQVLLCGHEHKAWVRKPGAERRIAPANFITVSGSDKPENFLAAQYRLTAEGIHICFVNAHGDVAYEEFIRYT